MTSKRVVAFLLLVSLALGCGRSDMGRVSGTITHAGKPVAGANVTFVTPSRRAAFGVTDAAGRYVLGSHKQGDGAYAGRHRVAVDAVIESSAAPAEQVNRADIPPKVRNLQTTPLEADVVAGKANVIDFDLAR